MPTARIARAYSSLRAYGSPALLALLFLGFSSGLPLALTASTLAIRLAEAGVNKANIGLFGAVALPYACKFLWAPVIDSLPFPLLTRLFGRRRGWLLGTQACLIAAIAALACANPAVNPWLTAVAALLVAFFSATQDVIIDAYRVELLPQEAQGNAAATYVLGYRLGMIVASAGALYLADVAGWTVTYLAMAALISVGALAAWVTGEPIHGQPRRVRQETDGWFMHAVVAPFRQFAEHPQWFIILCFAALYKLPDAFIGGMTGVFFIELGFTKTQIAEVAKLYGLVATIVGGFLAGWLMTRVSLKQLLWGIGLAQGLSNLLYLLLIAYRADMPLLALAVTGDNLISGMSGAVFVAYLSRLCNARFTATQYALLSSLANISRTLFTTPAGWAAQGLGWSWFFGLSALLPLPALALLALLHKHRDA